MKIALVSEFFYPTLGGVQEHLFNLAQQYTRRGHTVRIVTPKIFTRKEFEDWWPHQLPAEVHLPVGYSLPFFINGSRGRLTVGAFLGTQLKRLLTPENFDIVHLHAPLNGTLPILAAHYASTRLIGTFHTSFPGSKSLSVFRNQAQRQIDKIDRILGVSPISIDSISQYVSVNAEIVPNGVDTEYFRPRWDLKTHKRADLDGGRFNILYIGRPDPRNGLDTLISAYSRLIKRQSNLRLVVAGGGPDMKRYQAMTAHLPKDSVIFLGQVRDDRDEVYRSADIHVFGVEKATHSITILEGMASGLPIVTTPFLGHESLGEPGKHFEVTPFGDVDALVQKLEDLILDPARRDRLAKVAREQALGYDWGVIADKLLGIYQGMIDS